MTTKEKGCLLIGEARQPSADKQKTDCVCTVQSGQLKGTVIAACLSSGKTNGSVGTSVPVCPNKNFLLRKDGYEQNESYVSGHGIGGESYPSQELLQRRCRGLSACPSKDDTAQTNISVSFTPSQEARDAVANVDVNITQEENSDPEITGLKNLYTQEEGDVLSAGYSVRISGTRLHIAGNESDM